jgi:hypothetical protein
MSDHSLLDADQAARLARPGGTAVNCPECGASAREACKRAADLRCAREQLVVVVPINHVVVPINPEPVRQTPLGKDATCSYCGAALWVCRGVHNIC